MAASAKLNTTYEAETTDTTAPTTTTWQSVNPTANGSRGRSPAATTPMAKTPTPPLTHDDFRSDARREQYFLVPQECSPTPPPQHYDSDEESDTDLPYNNFAQRKVEVITAEPDDTTGILDSGAMMTTATRRHLDIHHHWLENIRPATPGMNFHPV